MIPEEIFEKTILIAPLDWGLGHTTRCISLIEFFLKANNKIVFAGNEKQIELVKNDYPNLIFELIDGYNIELDGSKSTYMQLLKQLNSISKIIKKESKIADHLAQKHQVDFIVSDNRYAFRSNLAVNIILTHQLSPPVPNFRKSLTKKIVSWVNSFNYCWIVDEEKKPICKDLNAIELNIPKIYIGWLTRFSFKKESILYDYLVVASGAQPERKRFKNELISVLSKYNFSFVVVDNENDIPTMDNIYVNPSTKKLEQLINSSHKVITRCGYTSIMELAKMKKQSILIPTKGQYEQEYLAQHLENDYFEIVSFEEIGEHLASLSR